MLCPHCRTNGIDQALEPVTRQDIEIDVCPRCGGIWLDKGELTGLSALYPAINEPDQAASDGGSDGDG